MSIHLLFFLSRTEGVCLQLRKVHRYNLRLLTNNSIVIPKEIRRTLRIRESDPSCTTLTSFDLFCRALLEFTNRVKILANRCTSTENEPSHIRGWFVFCVKHAVYNFSPLCTYTPLTSWQWESQPLRPDILCPDQAAGRLQMLQRNREDSQ